MVGVYIYVCKHENCKSLTDGIRKCIECGMIILTDKGVNKKW